MLELKKNIEIANKTLLGIKKFLNIDDLQSRLNILIAETEKKDFWEDLNNSQKVLKEKKKLEKKLNQFKDLRNQTKTISEMTELAESENETELLKELLTDSKKLLSKLEKAKIETMFSGEADSENCFIEIHAGAGGTESCDWAEMLLRMYSRYAERKKYKISLIEQHNGEEVGVKSATILVKGENAYGWLKNESGVHRLVRISPFDSNSRRHTSFASVWIYPDISSDIAVEINPADCRIDTYRASGAGGQHINTTDSAIRITHIPSKIVVQCQMERSQHRNKEVAFKMLKSRLYEVEMQKKLAEKTASESSKTEIGWGNQIRSYVLHPYQMVKDLRTNTESSNPKAVLDGELDEFLTANLLK
ncbi:MAG: peptide chain release factor 2 [Alphaproteobacteria bacterium]|nr:MAG: peptide chain release factor 2 [Rickettsiaceae bacterium 4572_127]